MKKYIIALSACLIAFVAVAFTKKKQLDPPDCTSIIIYFKVTGTFTGCDNAAVSGLFFPIPNDAAHVDVTNRAGNPFNCFNTATEICAIGYDNSEVVLNPITNKWELKPGKIALNYRCCVKRSCCF